MKWPYRLAAKHVDNVPASVHVEGGIRSNLKLSSSQLVLSDYSAEERLRREF